MTEPKPFYRARLRPKGQVTLPPEVRQTLGVGDGDDLTFHLNDQGQVVVERLQVIPPDQAWFWSRRWQEMEHEVDEQAAAGQMQLFEDVEALIGYLDSEHLDGETGEAAGAAD